MSASHPCPGCATPVPDSARYPSCYCNACAARATDGAGHALWCGNASLSGGFVVRRVGEAGTIDCLGIVALIDGAPVALREARFGGVVAQPRDVVPPADRARLLDLARPGSSPDPDPS